jgi:hypothetical protein
LSITLHTPTIPMTLHASLPHDTPANVLLLPHDTPANGMLLPHNTPANGLLWPHDRPANSLLDTSGVSMGDYKRCHRGHRWMKNEYKTFSRVFGMLQ